MIPRAGFILAALAVMTAGCKTSELSSNGTRNLHAWDGVLPEYEEVAKVYNERVEPLNRLFANLVLRLDYRDEEGVEHHEQVEGSCGFVRPRQFSLLLTKVGEPIAVLGSDPNRFWWIELVDRKRAVVGEHDKVGAERLAAAGVPVHPLDLIELLGITPLPTDPGAGQVSRSAKGELIVVVPSRFGSRRMVLPDRDYRPHRIELLGASGEVAASAVLTKYDTVAISGAGPGVVHPYIARDAVIVSSMGATKGHLELDSPRIDPSKPRPRDFDLDGLLRIKNVQEVIQIGDAPVPPPASARVPTHSEPR